MWCWRGKKREKDKIVILIYCWRDMDQNYLHLKDIRAYVMAFHLSDYVWKIVVGWEWFAKKTAGVQYVTAIDSMSANIAEGFGRYTKKDKIKFYRYSFGSMRESMDWTQKALRRQLLTQDQYSHIMEELQKLPREINHLIKYTESKLTI